ncbi:MAG: hypothetical protein KA981_12845, partial [Bacteroidia bacterium]|nr:hypothetical protein [Bacteroidia bacterium]
MSTFCFAQNFEWLKTYGTQTQTSQSFVFGICSKLDGGCTILVNLYSNNNVPDTIYFDTTRYYKPPKLSLRQSFLIEKDSTGAVINTALIGSFNAQNLCMDDDGNYYVIGHLTGVDSVGSELLDSANGAFIITKFDNSFKFIWAKQFGNSKTEGNL